MPQCNTSALISSAACFSCVPRGYFLPLKLALLSQLLVAKEGTLPDVQTLLDRASCFSCLTPGQLRSAKLQLLCNVLGGNVTYINSISPGPSGFQGNDPILGFPYPPVDYQLFITPILGSQFVSTNYSGPPAHLYWTVPDLNAAPVNYRIYNVSGANIYYAKRPAPVGPVSWTLIPSGHFSSEHSSTLLNQYVAFRLSPTANPGINEFQIGPCSGDDIACPIHGGAQAGWTSPPHQLWPGPSLTASVIIWDGRDANDQVPPSIQQATIKFKGPPPGDTIDHFTLERGHNDFAAGHVDSTFTNLSPSLAGLNNGVDDKSDRDANTNYFYRMTGYTVGGFVFPYNVVALIHPYVLTASRPAGATSTTLSWTPPDVSQWPTN